jgi:hypothetical protein
VLLVIEGLRDLVHPAAERVGIGDDKVLVNSSSLDHPLVVVAIEKKVMVGRTARSG